MPRFYPSGQRADAEYAFHRWLTLYMDIFQAAKPILRPAGIMEEVSSGGSKNYHVPIPPLGTTDSVEDVDGDEWPTKDLQASEVTGTCKKRGPGGIKITEDDLLERNIPIVDANVRALARSEALYEDKAAAAALIGGLTTNGFDNVPIFSTTHPTDPVSGKGAQSNLYTLKITPDNVLKIITNFRSYVTESNDPVFPEEPEFTLICHPALQADAEKVVDRRLIGEGGAAVDNVMYKRARLCVLPQLTDPQRWFIAVTNSMRKAILKVVQRPMRRWQLGPGSYLYENLQLMKMWCNEKTDYRLVDWRLIAASK